MVFAIQLEKRMANGHVFGVIISKLHHCLKSGLFILLKVDQNSKV